ncbi:MAG: SIR2 family protein [Bacteroidia bacterium]
MDKTLIILGAGASRDFCRIFPTGIELIKDINYHFLTEKKFPEVREVDGVYLSALMNDIVRTFGNDIALFNSVKNQLWNIELDYEWKSLRNDVSNPVSIDNFIATQIKNGQLNPKAAGIIKYSIYYLIKGTEQAFAEGNYDTKKNWIGELARKLSNYSFSIINENLTVVTFNYDRTFEKFFAESLNEFQTLNSDQVVHLQKNVQHVYDSLGSLNEIPFELENNKQNIIEQNYDRIKLIDDRNKMNLTLANAEKYKKVHFIGFGYDETNMTLIDLKRFVSATFHGTAYYYTNTQINDLKTKYNIAATDCSCKDYIKNLTI